VALALLLACPASGLPAGEPGLAPDGLGLPEVLPFETDVKEPVFAVLMALVRSGLYGVLTREHLERELDRRKARSRLPYRTVRDVVRLPAALGPTAIVTVHFEGSLDVPIPYSILWYHPGRIRGADSCSFREWMLGTVHLPHEARPGAAPSTLELSNVHLFGLDWGRLEVDIDGWLDRLMGSAIDDTEVNGLVVFRYAGRGYGMALGHNRSRRALSGAFDFQGDRIVFPYPSELKTVGRLMRWRLETLERETPAAGAP
jgi:hypothetical protein